jgi:tRNA (guanosine-2'-O-)-methyltransferase
MDQMRVDLIAHLSAYVTENRLAQFKRVLDERTRYITVVLEDIYQSQNASAVLRTCDCTGIQDVHIVEEQNEYQINRDVALGADQWLSLSYYREGEDNIYSAAERLKSQGYRIVATSPHQAGSSPESFRLDKGKVAIMFGTELHGLSGRALELADEYIQIPMAGFTESYNISVSAAIILYSLRKRLEISSLQWKLGEEEKQEVLLDWLRRSIRMSDQIENKFIRDYSSF